MCTFAWLTPAYIREKMDDRQQKHWCFWKKKSDRKQPRPRAGAAGFSCQMSPLQKQLNEAPQQGCSLSFCVKSCRKVCSLLFARVFFSHLNPGCAPEKTECLNCFVGQSEVEGLLLWKVRRNWREGFSSNLLQLNIILKVNWDTEFSRESVSLEFRKKVTFLDTDVRPVSKVFVVDRQPKL